MQRVRLLPAFFGKMIRSVIFSLLQMSSDRLNKIHPARGIPKQTIKTRSVEERLGEPVFSFMSVVWKKEIRQREAIENNLGWSEEREVVLWFH